MGSHSSSSSSAATHDAQLHSYDEKSIRSCSNEMRDHRARARARRSDDDGVSVKPRLAFSLDDTLTITTRPLMTQPDSHVKLNQAFLRQYETRSRPFCLSAYVTCMPRETNSIVRRTTDEHCSSKQKRFKFFFSLYYLR